MGHLGYVNILVSFRNEYRCYRDNYFNKTQNVGSEDIRAKKKKKKRKNKNKERKTDRQTEKKRLF